MTNKIDSYQTLLKRVWADENFKDRLLADPKAVLAEIGVQVPDSVRVEVHEDRQDLRNYILPSKEQYETSNLEAGNQIINRVIQQTLADRAFKSRLLQNPKAAIKEATGEDIPDGLTILFHGATPTVRHLVIPMSPVEEELSDSDLETVAGGKSFAGIAVGGDAVAR